MPVDIASLFGVPSGRDAVSDRVSLAVLLRFLAGLLEQSQPDDEGAGAHMTGPDEMRVRPRVEPLGGG